MATNKYFNNFNNKAQEKLYDDLINQCVKMFGVDSLYLVRESESAVDLIFGEDPTSTFTTAYPMEVYVENVDDYDGGELFSKFGLEVRKQARFLVTNRAFQRGVATQNPNNYLGSPNVYGQSDLLVRPREGDLLWFSNFEALFEIKFVDEEYFFYTFGNSKIYGYSMVCEKFRYSNERIETGVTDLDETVNNFVAAYDFIMANTANSKSYTIGEAVYQGANATAATANATIISWNLPSLTLTLKNIQGSFNVNSAIVGANSGARFNLVSYNLLQQVNPNIDNNNDLNTEGKNIINTDELNSFGDINFSTEE